MPTLHIDTFNAAGEKQGDGPVVTAMFAAVTRELSGAGEIRLGLPGADYEALSQLTNEWRVKIWVWDNPTTPKRLLGAGIVRQVGFREDASGKYHTVSGPDLLDELKRVNTWLGFTRDNASVATIVNDLVALASGWTTETGGLAGLDPLSVRLDGASALKGIQEVVANKGVHFRLTDTEKEIEFGVLGADTGLRVTHSSQITADLENNTDIALIERIEWQYDSEAIANRIVVLGPGDAEAAINATRAKKLIVPEIV